MNLIHIDDSAANRFSSSMRRSSHHEYYTGEDGFTTRFASPDKENFRHDRYETRQHRHNDSRCDDDYDDSFEDSNETCGWRIREEETEDEWIGYADEREDLSERIADIDWNDTTTGKTLQARPILHDVEKFKQRLYPVLRVSIIDVQGYRRDGHFILKSFALLDVCEFQLTVMHFKPPCPVKKLNTADVKTNRYIYECLSGKHWDSGDYPYSARSELISPLLARYQRIYVKGVEKINWMKTHTRCESVHFVDLITLGCPSLEDCVLHLKYVMIEPDIRMLSKEWTNERVVSNVLALFYWLCRNHSRLLYPMKSRMCCEHANTKQNGNSHLSTSFAKDADLTGLRDLINWILSQWRGKRSKLTSQEGICASY